ncbi:MAG: hypothetical protein C0501_15360 [Isosphaera sp.]|nr:hypothetical protein [Isosphaera sp.]
MRPAAGAGAAGVGRGRPAREGASDVTEDQAFVRAVVDGPGDETPRLVYADWLDDRGDPRGPYLRAEWEAVGRRTRRVRRADLVRLCGLARGLDPAWVARVSRPPLGACLEHLPSRATDEFGFGPRLTADDLAAFERRHGVSLPAEYRAFMLNHNGRPMPPCEVAIPAAIHPDDNHPWDTSFDVGDFMVIAPRGGLPSGRKPCPDEAWVEDQPDGRLVYIADDSIRTGTYGYYLGVSGDRWGRVYYHHKHLEVRYPLVADSFPRFLAALKPTRRR